MRTLSQHLLFCLGLPFVSLVFQPQLLGNSDRRDDDYYRRDGGGYRDDVYYGRRDPYQTSGPYGNGRHRRASGSLINQVIYDLRMAATNSYADGHEDRHFARALEQLQSFQDRWQNGRFDESRLNRAIEDIQHLTNADQLHPRFRNVLARDLRALRDFRRQCAGSYNGYRADPYNPRFPR